MCLSILLFVEDRIGDVLHLFEGGNCAECGMRLTQKTLRKKPAEEGPVESYACPPCGAECDQERRAEPGACPDCGMTMVGVAANG